MGDDGSGECGDVKKLHSFLGSTYNRYSIFDKFLAVKSAYIELCDIFIFCFYILAGAFIYFYLVGLGPIWSELRSQRKDLIPFLRIKMTPTYFVNTFL